MNRIQSGGRKHLKESTYLIKLQINPLMIGAKGTVSLYLIFHNSQKKKYMIE
jgi:hypothetical protein